MKKRTIPGAEECIYEDLRWAGLLWDEGRQSCCANEGIESSFLQDLLSVVHLVPINRFATRERKDVQARSNLGYSQNVKHSTTNKSRHFLPLRRLIDAFVLWNG